MIQVNRIYLIFNRLVTKKFLVDTSVVTIMQNEDDLRGLAKVTDFMRAISFLFLAIHIYWFCYG